MTGWQKLTLSECCEIISGATPSTSVEEYWDGEIFWATPKDLSNLAGHYISDTFRKITKSGLASCAATILPANSVLFSSRAPIGHVAINTVPMATNQGFKSLIPRPGMMDPKFLFHWLKANRTFLESLGVGATFKEVSKAVVAKIKIALPPLPEQRRITVILDKADALRTKRREALSQLDCLAQSIFVEMFGDPATNPKGWPKVTLGELVFSASDGPHVSPTYAESGIPFLSTRHIRPGEISWNDLKYISLDEAEMQWKKCRPKKGDILYTKGGTTGLAAEVKTNDPFAIWVHVALLKPNPEKCNSTWLEAMLNSTFCYRQSQELTHGIANRDLGLKRMVRIAMYSPPLKLQHEFSVRMQILNSLKARHKASISKLDVLFTSLQHQSFRDKLESAVTPIGT